MSERSRYTVSFNESNRGDNCIDKTVRVLIPVTDDMDRPTTELDVIEPAIKKMFGARATWKENIGVSPRYGQVFKSVKGGFYSSETGMAWLEIVKGW